MIPTTAEKLSIVGKGREEPQLHVVRDVSLVFAPECTGLQGAKLLQSQQRSNCSLAGHGIVGPGKHSLTGSVVVASKAAWVAGGLCRDQRRKNFPQKSVLTKVVVTVCVQLKGVIRNPLLKVLRERNLRGHKSNLRRGPTHVKGRPRLSRRKCQRSAKHVDGIPTVGAFLLTRESSGPYGCEHKRGGGQVVAHHRVQLFCIRRIHPTHSRRSKKVDGRGALLVSRDLRNCVVDQGLEVLFHGGSVDGCGGKGRNPGLDLQRPSGLVRRCGDDVGNGVRRAGFPGVNVDPGSRGAGVNDNGIRVGRSKVLDVNSDLCPRESSALRCSGGREGCGRAAGTIVGSLHRHHRAHTPSNLGRVDIREKSPNTLRA
eukprot:RCo000985